MTLAEGSCGPSDQDEQTHALGRHVRMWTRSGHRQKPVAGRHFWVKKYPPGGGEAKSSGEAKIAFPWGKVALRSKDG